jgi:hypothetical protein
LRVVSGLPRCKCSRLVFIFLNLILRTINDKFLHINYICAFRPIWLIYYLFFTLKIDPNSINLNKLTVQRSLLCRNPNGRHPMTLLTVQSHRSAKLGHDLGV